MDDKLKIWTAVGSAGSLNQADLDRLRGRADRGEPS
jgi:hypothetical protein